MIYYPMLASLGGCLLQLCPLIGHKHTIDHILGICIVLLKDDYADTRTGLLKHIDEIANVSLCFIELCIYSAFQAIDANILSETLLPALFELAYDKNWRTRTSCIEVIPFIAKKMVKSKTYI